MLVEYVYPGTVRIQGMKREYYGTDLDHLDKSCSHLPSHMHPVPAGSCGFLHPLIASPAVCEAPVGLI